MKKTLFLFLSLALLSNCKTKESVSVDSIYYNGDILTMEGDEPQYVEAVAVKDGKILFAGSLQEVNQYKGSETTMNDLQSKTLLPGFIDAHRHISYAVFCLTKKRASPPATSVPR